MAFVLENALIRAEFSEETGAICSLLFRKSGWILQADESGSLFTLCVPLAEHPAHTIHSENTALSSHRFIGTNALELTWDIALDATSAQALLRFTAHIALAESELQFDCIIENNSPYTVEPVAYPCLSALRVPTGGTFTRMNWAYGGMKSAELFPRFQTERGYWATEYPVQLVNVPESQFVLAANEREGLYAGCHDTNPRYSLQFFFELRPGVEDAFRHEAAVPSESDGVQTTLLFSAVHLLFAPANSTQQTQRVVLAPYFGDWQAGLAPYKAWRSSWYKAAPMPAWARDIGAWFQVQLLAYGGNVRYRYADLPRIARACKEQGICALQVTGWTKDGQDGCLPCHDTEPRLGTQDELRAAIAAVEAMGVHVILYVKYVFADTRTAAFRDTLVQYASRDKYGDIHSFCGYPYERVSLLAGIGTHRLAVMCMNSEKWLDLCEAEFEKCLALGASGILYDEPQHHHNMYVCFCEEHGHAVPAHTFAGDLRLAQRLCTCVKRAGREESFLLAGEACYDLESTYYPLSYIRVDSANQDVEHYLPVQRCVDFAYPYLCGVWGFHDRNTVNLCLLYGYLISYEPRHFRGEVDEFPKTLAYGRSIDALRQRYRAHIWQNAFSIPQQASVLADVCGNDLRCALYAPVNGVSALVVANFTHQTASFALQPSCAQSAFIATPEHPECQKAPDKICLAGRSAAVLLIAQSPMIV